MFAFVIYNFSKSLGIIHLEGIKPSPTWVCDKYRSGRVYPRQILDQLLPMFIENTLLFLQKLQDSELTNLKSTNQGVRRMRKWIWMMVFLPVLAVPKLCPAAYLIELKTGTSFITEEYWEEDGQVKFNHYGGIMGVSKEMILSITDSDAPVPEEIIRTDSPVIENLAESVETEKSLDENIDNKKQDPDFEKKVQECKETQWRIQDDRITQTGYFNTAKEQNNQAAKDEAWKLLIELNKEHIQLKQKVQNLYQGTLPEWWDEADN